MSTEKLFYEDQYIQEFRANIIEVKEKDDKFLVLLDKTAFFPGGGGQAADTGTIEDAHVLDVIEEGDKIYHLIDKKLDNTSVSCSIDWEKRLDGMQQHLGQHVLSGCFFSIFNANTAGIHLGKDISYVDIVGFMEEEQIRKAERVANEVIGEKHEVTFMMTSRKEAKSMGLRRDLATNDETIRVVKIQDLDINACCGVHPNNTLELQMIKIKGCEKHKGNTRIYFLAGKRAVHELLDRDAILDELSKILSTGADEAVKSLNALKNSLSEAREENKKIKASLSEFEVKELINDGEKYGDVSVIKKIYSNEDMKYLNKLAEKLVANDSVVVLFATKNSDSANLLFSASKNLQTVNVGSLLKDAISLIDGRGGGSKTLAQGGGKNIGNLDNAMDYALRKVKELL
ncbi:MULTISPECIES: DHHA1 domain-containing protein [Clostridium]|uniref:Alanyl-tRNA editing protein AlaX-L n=1 Tax=Clostridium cibarium TaxID=2762247 RepID=A0ABR8PVC9_9CLOT|nr:DHHA1 domain-containing protein [Clostridium sp. HBUAS56017]MBD7912131.1 alanyl-tRNA editing protein AlaX-L [Clostridium cibarium]